MVLTWNTSYPLMKLARRDRDCFPLPPTPTTRALPRGLSMMRVMRQMCCMATSNRTRSIVALLSLYSASFSVSTFCSLSLSETGR